MAIKKLQNNFTTTEQSKRLLELGVPADSADFFYDLECNNPPHANKVPWFCDAPYSEIIKDFPTRRFSPCWSVGRLIELLVTCAIDKDHVKCIIESITNYAAPVETYVNVITYLCKKKNLTFQNWRNDYDRRTNQTKRRRIL